LNGYPIQFFLILRCYQLLTLEPPFRKIPIGRVVAMVMNGERPPQPEAINFSPKIAFDDLWTLVEACWAQLPDQRPVGSDIHTRMIGLQRADATDLVTNDGRSYITDDSQIMAERKYARRDCNEAFSSKSRLFEHITARHRKFLDRFMTAVLRVTERKEEFICTGTDCGKSFRSSAGLKR
jgi:hypothetical protein